MSDVQKKLSALLGREVKQVRKTDETPPRVSVVDVAAVITGKDHNAAAQDLRRMSEKYPEVNAKCIDFKFPGQGQRKTRITDARGMVSVIMLLPGRHAARVRANCDLLVHNGFVFPDNQTDGLTLRLGVAKTDPLCAERTKLLTDLGINNQKYFVRRTEEPLDSKLVGFLRVLQMDQAALGGVISLFKTSFIHFL